MRLKFVLLVVSVFFLTSFSATASPAPDSLGTSIKRGNKMLAKGKFALALPYWQKVVAAQPDNANANFKLGLCMYNSLDRQPDAIPFFRKAVLNMTANYDFYSLTDQAPYDALYFLGETFLMANEPDSALAYFSSYQNITNGQSSIPVERMLYMCVNAKNGSKNPRNVKLVNLGKVVNTEYAESNPVLTLNNQVLFFSSRRPVKECEKDAVYGQCSEDIYISSRDVSGNWQEPQPFRFNTNLDEAPVYISPDGLTLFIKKKKKAKKNFDIYYSRFIDGVWNKPEPLKAINSAYNETGVSITGDGKMLYFASDRSGGYGKYDIYRCVLKSNGKWSKPENLGAKVNTAYNEIAPFVTPNGHTLFYSSNGYLNKGMGGYDVYYTETGENGVWTEPQNMGYPVNKTRNDLNYYIIAGGKRYFATINGKNSYDIYEIEGGGFDVETIDAGTEVVRLTTEMDVTEVMELEKEVEKEVEVIQTVETEVEIENVEEEIPMEDTLAAEEPEEEEPAFDFSTLDMERLDSLSRTVLISKVRPYIPKDEPEIKTNEPSYFGTLYFDFNQSRLSGDGYDKLQQLVNLAKKERTLKIEIVGHADAKGSWMANKNTSQRRSEHIYQYLRENDVPQEQIIYYGKSDIFPVASNETEEGRSKNRRVEVWISK